MHNIFQMFCKIWHVQIYFRYLNKRSNLFAGSLSVSVLSGKIMFRAVHYVTEDFSIRIDYGWIIFRWWRPYVFRELGEGILLSFLTLIWKLVWFEGNKLRFFDHHSACVVSSGVCVQTLILYQMSISNRLPFSCFENIIWYNYVIWFLALLILKERKELLFLNISWHWSSSRHCQPCFKIILKI